MKRNILVSACFLLGALALSSAYAEKAQTPKEQLQREATHVVVGKVHGFSFTKTVTSQYEITKYIAEIQVDTVEKGQGVNPGDMVQVRYLSNAWRGSGPPPPHDSGHRPRPQINDVVRVYLVNKGYNGAGYTTDGGYDVYYNNGFEILARSNK